jgi:hypothetical protein
MTLARNAKISDQKRHAGREAAPELAADEGASDAASEGTSTAAQASAGAEYWAGRSLVSLMKRARAISLAALRAATVL